MEDYAYVLDVLPEGRPDSKRRFRREPLVYGLGIEEFKIYRIFPGGDIEFLHPKDGVFPEKVNEGREKVGHNPRRIGENPNPAGLKFTTKNTFD